MRLIPSLCLTVVSAALYGEAFAPMSHRFLAWVALTPLLFVIQRTTLRRALGLTWLWSIAMAQIVAGWLPGSVANYYEQPFGVGLAVALSAETLQVALHYMLFAAYWWTIGPGPGPIRPILAAAGWVGAELSRVGLFWGNPLAVLGYSQVGVTPLIQIADVTGVYGVSFVVMAVNAALLDVWLAATDRSRPKRPAILGVALACGIFAVALAYGLWTVQRTDTARRGGTPIEIAVVQGQIDLGSQWRPEFYGRNLDVYLDLTREALEKRDTALVVWPENVMTFFVEEEAAYRRAIAGVLSTRNAQLVAGGPRYVSDRSPLYYNSAFLISPQGSIVAHYDKETLLPLAEFFPLSSVDFLRRRFGRVREFTPGAPTPPLPTVAGPAGVLICNEAMFPEIAAARVRAGAAYLINLANDTWLGDREWGPLAFDIVSLRAVEQRRFVVRASTSGPSAIVDPLGQPTALAAHATRATLSGSIAPSDELTIYYRIGDLFAWICIAGALSGAFARRRKPHGRDLPVTM